MDDLIRRQAAIDALNDEYHGMISDESMKIYQIINWLSELPSAERRGRWIGERLIYPSGIILFIYLCSECGHEERHAYEDAKPSNYCPNCGARMEE